MSTVAAGGSGSVTIAPGGSVSIASNGGFWQTTETPTVGSVRSTVHGPTAHTRVFGPFPLGATLSIVNQTVGVLNYVDYEVGTATNGTILVGAAQTFTLGDQGTLAVSNPAGYWQAVVTPAIGSPSTAVYGPGAGNMTFGPFPGGATVVVTNQSGATLVTSAVLVSGSGALAPLAVAVQRPVANRTKSTFVNTHLSDGTNKFGVYRSRHRIFPGWDCSGGFRVWYCNRSADTNGQNPITVSGRVEVPAGSGNWTALTFSAAGSITLQATDADVGSDALALTPAGGTYINVETHVSVASAGQKWPMLDSISLAAANSEGSALSTTSDPGVPPNLDTTEFYGPVAITGLSKAPYAAGVFSDSIGNGAKDTPTGDKIGFLQRIIGDSLPIINFSTSGDTLASFVAGNSRRLGLADQCGLTDAILAYGTNDTKVLATLQANYRIAIGLMNVRGWNLTACPVLTSTTTTNSWTAAADQTVVAGYDVAGTIDQFNTWIQTQVGLGIDKFVDTRVGWQDAANKILTTGAAFGYTPDGLHPGPFGNQQMAAPYTVLTALPLASKVVARSYLNWSGLRARIAPTLEAATATVSSEPNLVNGTAALTPGSGTTAVTARSAATFFNIPMLRQTRSGTSDSSVLTAPSTDTASTMLRGTNVDYTFLIAFAADGSGVGFTAGWCSPINGTTTDQAMLVYRSAANTGWRYGRTGDTNLDVNITSPAIVPANKMHVMGVIHSAGKTSIWFDSKTASITNATQAPTNAFDTNTQFMLGNSVLSGATPPFSTNGWGGWTGVAMGWDNARSVAEMQQAIQDLANEFGILLS